ncbi:MAG: DUF481 domain-containing protein [Planctomycetes bacterium]|nr:DUF481 domain-containing protein [Planctomycetota bacterium]
MLILPILLFTLPIDPSVTTVVVDTVPPAIQDAATPAEPKEPKWTGSVSLGASIADGDSDTRSASSTADAEYRRENDRFKLGFAWNYQQDKNATPSITQRRSLFKAQYDYFFSKRTYGLVQASAEADKAADLALRTTIGVGAGHQFLEDEAWIGEGTWKVSAEVGVTHIDEDFDVAKDNDYMSARAAYSAAWTPNAKWGLSQTCEIFPSLEDSDDLLIKLDTRGKMALTEKMFGQLQWLWTYDNTPATGLSRTNDIYALTIGWSF